MATREGCARPGWIGSPARPEVDAGLWALHDPSRTPPMPARDLYHDAVVRALGADGWKITHDPLTLSFGGRDLFVDLGATHIALGASRQGERIAVEIKSFLSPSP